MEQELDDILTDLDDEQQRLQLALSSLAQDLVEIERQYNTAENDFGIPQVNRINYQYESLVDRIKRNKGFKNRLLEAKIIEAKRNIKYGL